MTSGITRYEAEEALIDRFINGYKNRFGFDLVIVSHRDRPDFEVLNRQTGEKVGIEITGLYQSEREAKINYGREPSWERFSGSWDLLIANLNHLLAEKAEKSRGYQYCGRMFLAIYVGSLVFNETNDFDYVHSRIAIPENRFSEIWLMLRDSTGRETVLKALEMSST